MREALDDARAAAASEQQLRDLLAERHIEAVFRRTEDGRIYGATFIDHSRRIVLNGSRLGKAYAARAWDEWARNPQPSKEVAPIPQPNDAAPTQQSNQRPMPTDRQPQPELLGNILLDALDAFAPLFEHEPQHEEYIDPEFRLLYRKKKKKKKGRKL